MLTPKFKAIKKSGQLIFDRLEVRDAYIFGLKDGNYEEIIQKPQDPKSLQQLRYIHGVVFKVASETSGYTDEEVKGLLKEHFLKRYIQSPTGKEVSYVPSLGDLKKEEMADFIDKCIQFIAMYWHAVVPSPDEVNY